MAEFINFNAISDNKNDPITEILSVNEVRVKFYDLYLVCSLSV